MSKPRRNTIARLSALGSVVALCALASTAALTASPPAEGAVTVGWMEHPRVVKSVAGDFNGDGLADYVDHDRSTGNFYVHTNLGAQGSIPGCFDASSLPKLTGFTPNGTNWKVGHTSYETTSVPSTSVMIGDFNGDHFADFAEHDDATGWFVVALNDTLAGGQFHAMPSSGPTCTGDTCEVLVADFTGDGCADYADHDLSTGTLYVHENLFRKKGWVTFAPAGQNWATTQTCVPGTDCEIYPGDFNGDGYADLAVRHPAFGWGNTYLRYQPSSGTYVLDRDQIQFTCTGRCETFTGDFDGDGKVEYASHDPLTGTLTLPTHPVDLACTPLTWSTCGGVGCDLLGLPGGWPVW